MGLMRALVQYGSAQVSAKLGRCPKCMRLSLIGAISGWLVLGGIVLLQPRFPFTNLLVLWPASFTALWFLHILTYATRATVYTLRKEPSVTDAAAIISPVYSRRRMVGAIAGSTAFVILATGLKALGTAVAASCHEVCCSQTVACPCQNFHCSGWWNGGLQQGSPNHCSVSRGGLGGLCLGGHG